MSLAVLKSQFNKIEQPMKKFFLFSCLDLTVGAVGMLLYGIFSSTYGPIWVRNQYIGLWLLTLLFFTSIQSLYLELKKWSSKLDFVVDIAYYSASMIITFILFVLYCIPPRIDGLIWAFYIFAVNLTNVSILFIQRSHFKNLTPNNRSKILRASLKAGNTILRLSFIIVTCFLINSASQESTGKVRFPARGKFVDLKISNTSTKTVKFHYLCDGPSSNLPVFLFEGSASHGLADYLSIQKLLKQNNRRSCIWDKPGLGYSDYLLTDIKSYSDLYDNLVNSLNEKGPFEFVAWAGGGPLLYEYAYNHPEMFKSLTFLDVSPVDIEFKIIKELKKWSDKELEEYRKSEYSFRRTLFGLINGIAVPFGFTYPFAPTYKALKEFDDEVKWYFWTEKTWITQEYFLKSLFDQQDIFEKLKINQSIPINIVMTVKTDDQIKEQVCKKRSYAFDSDKCKYEIESNKLSIEYRSKLKSLSLNGKMFNCTSDDCDLGYYVGSGASFTVDKLLQL